MKLFLDFHYVRFIVTLKTFGMLEALRVDWTGRRNTPAGTENPYLRHCRKY